MKLSDNFYLHEFQRSETAVRFDIQEQFRPLPSHIINNINDLVKEVLQPLRVEFQAPMHINSGYRSEALNSHPRIRGSSNSDHLRGQAADIVCRDPQKLYTLAMAMNLPFKQLILYKNRNFVHISYDRQNVRRQNWIQ